MMDKLRSTASTRFDPSSGAVIVVLGAIAPSEAAAVHEVMQHAGSEAVFALVGLDVASHAHVLTDLFPESASYL